ncbi:hypothetical protein NW762_011658 [Fusarium torreyae]|uniref:Uncharacterized protein n=1 Tax=Fusarium torreyae TaxID=1237075 RepID=A0A9W8VCA1_9HYPO|nr:hypothetical protein NW762_011658 [Fusarium torreyae]
MSLEGIPDHDTFWGDTNNHLKQQTKDCAERAQQVVSEGYILDHIWHPWLGNNPFPINNRIRIFEFGGDHCDLPEGPLQFDTTKDLLVYWENTPKDGTAGKTNRRVIILEDMHPRVIELLGVLLDIPPEFFLAHCEEFADLSVVDSLGESTGSSVRWKVPVPQRRDLPYQPEDGIYQLRLGNMSRSEVVINKSVGFVQLSSFVSYWGKEYDTDSWTAVILTDPHQCNLDPMDKELLGNQSPVELTDWTPARDISREFRLGSALDDTARQHRQPIFDTIVRAYDEGDLRKCVDPFSATIFTRHTIRSIWEEFVIRALLGVDDIEFEDGREQNKALGAQTSSSTHNASSYGRYQYLMVERQDILKWKRRLQNIMWCFQCRMPSESKSQSQQEHGLWRILEEKLEAADTTLGEHMNMFAQRAALVQARSSGQLAKIATVIVPCTFVASIFSMNGKFAAGEEHFFVYWVVSIPITIILLSWILAKDEDTIQFLEASKQAVVEKVAQGNQKLTSLKHRRNKKTELEDGGTVI